MKRLFLGLTLSFFVTSVHAADSVDTTQLQCLAANIYTQAETPEDRERIGWISHNRVASGEFGASYCDEAIKDIKKPWQTDASALVRNLASAKSGSANFKKAQKALKDYRSALLAYQQSQVVAYRILKGQGEDVTAGATEYQVADEEDS